MYREKKYECGNFLEVEVFTKPEREKIYSRSTRVSESTPAQKNLNNKKAKRYFVRLVHKNFTQDDLYVDLTYDKVNIPQSRAEVIRDIKNYTSRLRRKRNKLGLPPLKYIYVISNMDNNGNKVRYHVHMIINDIQRDIAEGLWNKGRANTDRLQFDEYGVEGKSLYMAGQAKGNRAWGSSTRLEKPEPKIKDNKYTRKIVERIERNPEDREYFERLYPGWTFTDCTIYRENDEGLGAGTSFLIRLRRYDKRWKGGFHADKQYRRSAAEFAGTSYQTARRTKNIKV